MRYRFQFTHLDAQLIRHARTSLLLSLLLAFSLNSLACRNDQTSGNANTQNAAPPTASPQPSATTQSTVFDGSRAMEHVRKQVEFGPRPAGSAELAKTRDYISGELKSYGLNVTSDEFRATTPDGEKQMVNVTAELAGESSDVIIISSHYDTKPFKQFRFVGANDGGSSTGALMELARVMTATKQKPRFTYWFVFFDGEEAFCEEWTDCRNPDGPDNTYGSRHYVAQLKARKELKRIKAMILLDMIGYKELQLGRNDTMSTRWLIDVIWKTARETGHGDVFVDELEACDGDDCVPFLEADIDAIDIIQLGSYPYWHTAEDTLDKISPRSLKAVGDVVVASLPRIEEEIPKRAAR
jgi:Zn-dependent M28 family amino/carboxypeptidase